MNQKTIEHNLRWAAENGKAIYVTKLNDWVAYHSTMHNMGLSVQIALGKPPKEDKKHG